MRVLVFGASSVQGLWDSQGGWVDRLKNHYISLHHGHGFEVEYPWVINLGISGDTTASLIKRIKNETQARLSDKGVAIVIQIGMNNAAVFEGKPMSSVEVYKKELEEIIDIVKEFTNKILVVGFAAVDETKTTPMAWANMHFKNDDILKFENAAAEVAASNNLNFVPVHEEFKKRRSAGEVLNAHDGLHPNDKGHQLFFDLVLLKLSKIIS